MESHRSDPVLLAAPSTLHDLLQPRLESMGMPVVLAASPEEALLIIRSQPLSGLMTTTEWSISHDGEHDRPAAFVKAAGEKMPVVFIIDWKKSGRRFFELRLDSELLQSEYVSVPFDWRGLVDAMRRLQGRVQNRTGPDDGQTAR
jgi:hypothetical protein